jgi:hypothetical protein
MGLLKSSLAKRLSRSSSIRRKMSFSSFMLLVTTFSSHFILCSFDSFWNKERGEGWTLSLYTYICMLWHFCYFLVCGHCKKLAPVYEELGTLSLPVYASYTQGYRRGISVYICMCVYSWQRLLIIRSILSSCCLRAWIQWNSKCDNCENWRYSERMARCGWRDRISHSLSLSCQSKGQTKYFVIIPTSQFTFFNC